jgi:hypothetical protein
MEEGNQAILWRVKAAMDALLNFAAFQACAVN